MCIRDSDGKDLVMLATPLPTPAESTVANSALAPTIVVSVNFLWNRPGTAVREKGHIEARGGVGTVPIFCTCQMGDQRVMDIDVYKRQVYPRRSI